MRFRKPDRNARNQYPWSAAMFRDPDHETQARVPAVLESRAVDVVPPREAVETARPAKRGFRLALNKRTLIAGAAALAIIAGGGFGAHWWVTGRYIIST